MVPSGSSAPAIIGWDCGGSNSTAIDNDTKVDVKNGIDKNIVSDSCISIDEYNDNEITLWEVEISSLGDCIEFCL
jgi:hypothetical protein